MKKIAFWLYESYNYIFDSKRNPLRHIPDPVSRFYITSFHVERDISHFNKSSQACSKSLSILSASSATAWVSSLMVRFADSANEMADIMC